MNKKQSTIIALDTPRGDCKGLLTDDFVWLEQQEKIVRNERFFAGMARAWRRNSKVGRKPILDTTMQKQIRQPLGTGYTKKFVTQKLEFSPVTVHKAIKQMKGDLESQQTGRMK